jgi:hypothetical protein
MNLEKAETNASKNGTHTEDRPVASGGKICNCLHRRLDKSQGGRCQDEQIQLNRTHQRQVCAH